MAANHSFLRITFLVVFSAVIITGNSQTYLDPDAPVDERVDDLLSRMTLEEKVGQMTQAERANIVANPSNIENLYLGSVLSGGGSTPEPNTVENWVEMYNNLQSRAMSTRLGVPILYGVDAVHGHNNLVGAVIFPHNIGLGCTRNSELVRQCAEITALEVRATGLQWTFSPCVSVPQNEYWGRTYEGFGESPGLVDSLSRAAILGYQSDSLGMPHHILACSKHFVGDGGTTNGIDQGNTQVSEEKLREIHLPPYISNIDAGVGSVMASFSSWNGEKCHGSEYLVTDVLKEELGFEGFVLSDWQGINQLDGDFSVAVKEAVNAGIDLAMQPYDYIQYTEVLHDLAGSGEVPMERIDDAVERILRIKFRMGLFENPYADMALADTVGCEAHREVARQAVRESIVLLKNDGMLPLSQSNGEVLVAGAKADDVGAMCGGWSISWQGSMGSITEGTTVYEAVRQKIGHDNTLFSQNPSQIPDADYAVVVVGEAPYAEGAGDVFPSQSKFTLSHEDQAMIDAVEGEGIPMVVVLLSGRPLDIRTELNQSNVFLAAWLPGTEGGKGIADVIFGDYNPTGKLSHTWPESYDDVPINVSGDYPGHDALFPYGFGLSYDEIGVGEQQTGPAFKAYPNPAAAFLIVQPEKAGKLSITLRDMTGNAVIHQTRQIRGREKLHIGHLAKGVYILEVNDGEGTTSRKIIRR
ncbi:MAG: glycoside hydrolase family 3 C-terminal domain-containing protein [Bacteroidales bacterium]|nr:glycoside hydrolase family 3 C-terminal domain-containing protein [Bacteroidales bacterium]